MDLRKITSTQHKASWSAIMLATFKLCLVVLMLLRVPVSTIVIIALIGSAAGVLLSLTAARSTREGGTGETPTDSIFDAPGADHPRETAPPSGQYGEPPVITPTGKMAYADAGWWWTLERPTDQDEHWAGQTPDRARIERRHETGIGEPVMPTLTFLSYEGFAAELSRRRIDEVRMESGTHDEYCGSRGPWRNFIIALTALSSTEGLPQVLACTLRVGGCWAIFADRHPECVRNLETAVEILTQDFQANGTAVLQGVYGHEMNWVYADPSRLWHFLVETGTRILVPGADSGEQDIQSMSSVGMEEVTR